MTYSISPYQDKKRDRLKFIHGSEDHKQFILDRAITKAAMSEKFEPGDYYYVQDCKEKGMILCYAYDMKEVEWEGLKPKFVELWFENENTSHLYHPSDLRKR